MNKFEKKCKEFNELYELCNKVNNKEKKNLLLYNLWSEFDHMINNIEQIYYNIFINENPIYYKNILQEKHESIMSSQNTMQIFLPYMMAYNIMQQEYIKEIND